MYLRAIMLIVLTVGLLPWGAYSGSALPGPAVAHVVLAPEGSGLAAKVAPAPSRQAVLRDPGRRCQRTALPGGPCGMDMIVHDAREAPRPTQSSAWASDTTAIRRDWTPPGALDPPRQG